MCCARSTERERGPYTHLVVTLSLSLPHSRCLCLSSRPGFLSVCSTCVPLSRSLAPSFTLTRSVSLSLRFAFGPPPSIPPSRPLPLSLFLSRDSDPSCPYTAYLLSPLFVAAIPAGRKQREKQREKERERECARVFSLRRRCVTSERSRRLRAESARVPRYTWPLPTLSLSAPFSSFVRVPPVNSSREREYIVVRLIVARVAFHRPAEQRLLACRVPHAFSAPAFRPIGFRPSFPRGEFSPSLVPHTACPSLSLSLFYSVSLLLTISLSSSHHHRLSLFVPPSPCFHLCHPFAASLSHSLFLSRARSLVPSRSLWPSLSPRVSFSPAFLTARVRSLLHEGGETSVALRGYTRARAESRLIADERTERFLRSSLCILLLRARLEQRLRDS